MDKDSLLTNLNTRKLGKTLHFFKTIDSTNIKAKSLAYAKELPEGTTLVAEQQTLGKGTDGNTWHSTEGNLYLSIVFPYNERITTLFPLYPAVALAKVLNEKFNIPAHVKWPNDILVGSKKIAGILCEGAAGKFMIMGLGINILQTTFQGEIENTATSIALESKKDTSIEAVFQTFLQEYESLFYSNTDICQEWINLTQMIGKTINTTQDGVAKSVIVSGLSPEGFLEITNQNGEKEVWMARRGLDISAEY